MVEWILFVFFYIPSDTTVHYKYFSDHMTQGTYPRATEKMLTFDALIDKIGNVKFLKTVENIQFHDMSQEPYRLIFMCV